MTARDGAEDARKGTEGRRILALAKGAPLRCGKTYDSTGHQFGLGRVGSALLSLRAQQGADYNIIANYRQKLRRIHERFVTAAPRPGPGHGGVHASRARSFNESS